MASTSSLDSGKLDALLPTGPVHSLRQVQAVYGALAEAASGGSTPPGQEEYSLYFTPSELEPFIAGEEDEERFLVSVRVDFTRNDPSFEGIEVVPLSPGRVPPLGFASQSDGKAIDHSITRRGAKGGSDPPRVVEYCLDCLERWTNGRDSEPAVGKTADEHADGWIIHELVAFGADKRVQEQIEREVGAKITNEPRVVTTVKLRLDPADLERPPIADEPDWFYPGEIPLFNEAMVARKKWKLISKNIGNKVSEGEGVCQVTSNSGHVVGTSADPFDLYTLQHTEKFDNLDRTESWREHPISDEAALLLDAGTGLLDACRETRNGLGVYTLPYFTRMTPERAALLHRTLSELGDQNLDEQHKMVWIQESVEEHERDAGDEGLVHALRFYVVAIRDETDDSPSVFNEVPDATIYPPRDIAETHCKALDSETFGWAGFERPENWRHIHSRTDRDDVVSSVIGGSYAQDTVSFGEGSDGAMANEPSEWLSFAMLAGERIDREWLLGQYVTRLAQQRERDDEDRLAENHLLTQLAQLDALAGTGLLAGSDGREDRRRKTEMNDIPTTSGVLNPMAELPNIGELTTDGVPSLAEIREYRLREFLADRFELGGDDGTKTEGEERRGAFLIGVLLGELSTHQRKDRRMQRTFANRYQAEDVTLGQLEGIMTELLSKDSVYEAEHRYSRDGSCFPETSGRLSELADNPPSGWSLSLPDVRFHFALGVTYGLHARNRAFELREVIEKSLDSDSDNETDET